MTPENQHIMGQFRAVQALTLDIARQPSDAAMLRLVVNRLAEWPGLAYAGIWITQPADQCDSCPSADLCHNHSPCMHLAFQSGASLNPATDLSVLWPPAFARVPIGHGPIGQAAATHANTLATTDQLVESPPVADWARDERLQGISAQPITYQGHTIGILAVAARTSLTDTLRTWLRTLADHMTVAMANHQTTEALETKLSQTLTYCDHLRASQDSKYNGPILGHSHAIRNIQAQVKIAAESTENVIIIGHPATGKRLIAHTIHRQSPHHAQPCLTLTADAITPDTLEQLLVGNDEKPPLPNGSTVIIQDIDRLSQSSQIHLLSILSDGASQTGPWPAPVIRLIATSTADLSADGTGEETLVTSAAGTPKGSTATQATATFFIRDLYYQLAVMTISVPPLADRKEDIGPLAEMFAVQITRQQGRPPVQLTQAGILQLQQHTWSGNIDQLQHAVYTAVMASSGSTRLNFDFLATLMATPNRRTATPIKSCPATLNGEIQAVLTDAEMKKRERSNTLAALSQSGWRIYGKDGAANLLGIRPTTLASRIKKMGLTAESQP